jgi:hypothetical protein
MLASVMIHLAVDTKQITIISSCYGHSPNFIKYFRFQPIY